MLNKKSQVTVVIILGMIVFLSLMLAIYLQELYVEGTLKPHIYTGTSLQAQYDSLNAYVSFCLKDAIDGRKENPSPIIRLAKQGGILTIFNDYIDYNPNPNFFTDRINVLCRDEENKGCVQNILTKESMEQDLALSVRLNFIGCFKVDEFRNKGYIVEYNQSKLKIDTTIGKDDISFKLYYPLEIHSPDNKEITLSLEQWVYKVNAPLGRLYDLVLDIVNEEASNGFFDKDAWMLKNNALIIIEKHKPYPNTVYQLRFGNKDKNLLTKDRSKELIFQFAIRGIDSAGKTYPNLAPSLGCCKLRDYCYKNTEENACSEINGTYENEEDCTCTQKSDYKEITQYISDCSYNNKNTVETKKHGSSWCSYNAIAGKAYDYVGSRHYLNTCINGEIIIEECRDFREELCTENIIVIADVLTNANTVNNTNIINNPLNPAENITKAVCRKNRWQDCMQCTSKQCCEDINTRDCIWKDYLKTDKKCLPYVSPGLKFWTNEPAQLKVCNAASQKTEFLGLKTNNAWIDSSAILCYGTGDCGNYRNIANDITKFGFRNTDGAEQEYVYLTNDIINNGNNNKKSIITLPINAIAQPQLASEEELFKPSANYPAAEEIANTLKNLDSYNSELFDKYKRDSSKRPALSRCNLWQAPQNTDKCTYCTKDSSLGEVCSEYKCKSLGQECRFTYNRGIPQCNSPENIDLIPPKIEIDNTLLPENYKYKKATFGPESKPWFNGYLVEPEILPHDLFTFGITTSEESICKTTYLPESDFNLLPAIWFGDNTYKTSHNISIRLPGNIELPDNFFKANNLNSLADLAKNPAFTNKRNNLAVLKLLDEFKQGNYHLFIKCNDKFGNTNSDEFFIKFNLKSDLEDTDAPNVLEIIPQNGSIISRNLENLPVKLYVNEPAECRASTIDINFENMEYKFSCPSSKYDVTGVAAGSYECTATLPFAENYYIRCMDKPLQTAEFLFAINYTQPNITDENLKLNNNVMVDESINFASYYAVLPDINVLKNKNFLFNFDKDIELRFGINAMPVCKISDKKIEFGKIQEEFECMSKESYNSSNENSNAPMQVIDYIENNFTELFTCAKTISIPNNSTTYYIKCRDKNITEQLANEQIKRNVASESYVYILQKSAGLNITSVLPNAHVDTTAPKLIVTTSGNKEKDNLKCSYKKNAPLENFYSMSHINNNADNNNDEVNNAFVARLNKLNNFEEYEYDFKCINKYGDVATASARFTVIMD